MKKTILLCAIFILGFLSVYSQMSSPETIDTTTFANDLALLENKVKFLQIIVIASFSINLILSVVIIYALMKKSKIK
ncbi:MAG: hypothetical protein IPH20_12660 [Bacteroidales bacterium]|nr:hypothetical protein [Bacteroidales bacterium]